MICCNFEVWVKDFKVFDLRFEFSMSKSTLGQARLALKTYQTKQKNHKIHNSIDSFFFHLISCVDFTLQGYCFR